MSTIDFKGRVALVTGAGNGLGRSHALEFARRGAKVVVNDLGGSRAGSGSDVSVAQSVVDEIRAAGGEAVADTHSVLDGERLVQTALDAFGRLDILVNNAGFLRDSAFHKMDMADWELIRSVHLDGAARVTRAAWSVMRDNSYGRIIMTSSAAGLYGNFGQANYSAAKLGLHGLAQTLAAEGRSRNILVNSIAPVAASRLTETVMTREQLDALQPGFVTPLVMLLTSEGSDATGQMFEVGGGCIFRVRWERSAGARFDIARGFDAEDLRASWDAVQNFEGGDRPANVLEAFAPIGDHLGVDLGLAPQ